MSSLLHFRLQMALYPESKMFEIHISIDAEDARRRANATELLDATISQAIKHQLLPLDRRAG